MENPRSEGKSGGTLGKLVQLLFPRKRNGNAFRPFDFGVLKVSMMVAAIDGKVLEHEIATFLKLARKCRGWTADAAADALSDGLHSAGYLMIQSQRLSERQLIAAFVDEAVQALPSGFASGSTTYDLRRAFVMWTAMVSSDRKYAVVERKALLALRKRLELTEKVSDRFLREIESQFLRLGHEDTVVDAVRLLRNFIDFDDV